MDTAYLLVTILFAAMVAFSAIAKIRPKGRSRDPGSGRRTAPILPAPSGL